MTKNQVLRITLTGGLIGLFSEDPRKKLENKIQEENNRGWKVVQVINDASANLLTTVFRLILLLVTLTLYSQADGFLVVMEKND